MFIELGRNSSLWPMCLSEILAVHVVEDAIGAVLKTTQLNRPVPCSGKERIVKVAALADNMRLRTIEPDVVKIAEILASRQHLVFVDAQPLFKHFLALRSQVRLAVFRDKLRQHEHRSDNSAYADSGSEINRCVAQLNVITQVGNAVTHESFESFSLGADLKRTLRIGCDRHIEMRHGEKRVGSAAGAKF